MALETIELDSFLATEYLDTSEITPLVTADSAIVQLVESNTGLLLQVDLSSPIYLEQDS